jgi:uncharacterized protein (UPF0218 family)
MQLKLNKIIFKISSEKKKERLFYLSRNKKFKNLRKQLKKPLGFILVSEYPKSLKHILSIINNFKYTSLISVGDFITLSLLEMGIKPNLAIIDGKVMRQNFNCEEIKKHFKNLFEINNPQGTILKEAYDTIITALKNDNSLLVVNGEEDLLTLLAILESKENSLILYGIPNLGVCFVFNTRNKKLYIKKLYSKGILENV